MNDVAKTLREARRLLAEVGWTTGGLARTTSGSIVDAMDESAVCFCASGAVIRASKGNPYIVADRALRKLQRALDDEDLSVPTWNDHQVSVTPVLAAFDKAIALAEAM